MKWFWTSYTSHSLLPHWGPDSEAPEIGYKWLVWFSLGQKHWTKKTFYHVQNQSYNFMPSSCSWSPTAPRPCSWPPDQSEVPETGLKWFPQPQNIGMIPKLCLKHDQNQSYNFTPWGRSGPPTDPPPCSWPSDRSEAPENCLQWFPLPQNIQFDTKIVSLA